MKTLILKTASEYLLPLLLLFSIFILLRGHYEPGGGFVGGLIAATAFVLHAFANGLEDTWRLLKIHPRRLIPVGLITALVAGSIPLFLGQPFFTILWYPDPMPVIGMVSTALLFDVGVYLVVFGITLTILFTISESV